ncbi:hypothetical protein OG520_44750 (plasmid) [Streptomyces sp. NBC_00984]|uniref:hypothetical protein n=1 Tax=Streptomyces sp. NBC_00984 TaxID=2903700 RepID=UPI002F90F270|nr:hypothetical protein OG520_44750 [Streptomyces sp. NBC_00984]
MADDLHTRYMRASDAWRTHRKGCSPCGSGQDCPDGAQMYQQFADLQNDYLRLIRSRGGT